MTVRHLSLAGRGESPNVYGKCKFSIYGVDSTQQLRFLRDSVVCRLVDPARRRDGRRIVATVRWPTRAQRARSFRES